MKKIKLSINYKNDQELHLYTPPGFFDSSLNIPPLPFSYPISFHWVKGARIPQFPAWEQEHLNTKAAIPYRDPSGCSSPAEIHHRRQAEQVLSNAEPTSRWKKRWLNPAF